MPYSQDKGDPDDILISCDRFNAEKDELIILLILHEIAHHGSHRAWEDKNYSDGCANNMFADNEENKMSYPIKQAPAHSTALMRIWQSWFQANAACHPSDHENAIK